MQMSPLTTMFELAILLATRDEVREERCFRIPSGVEPTTFRVVAQCLK
jgi:hypothetical protein